MIVSLNEAEVMATKAANGAGRPWGLAQEAGRAVARLHAFGLDGASALLGLLRATDGVEMEALTPTVTGGAWAAVDGPACPIVTGVYLADLGGMQQPVKIASLYEPLLMLPFLQAVEGPVELSWQGGCMHVNGSGFGFEGEVATSIAAGASLKPSVASQPAGRTPGSGPVDIDGEVWEALGQFAHRTYVPATEASRLKGAGAGLTDND